MKRERKKKLISIVDKWNEQMNLIKEKTGIKGIYVIIVLIGAVIFVYFNIFENLITNLVGTVYPSFWTIKAIESKNKNDIKKWLTYWIVFGVFIIIDFFNIIIVKIFPYYFLMKIMFLIWLFMPGSNGCTIVYHLFVKKIFNSFEDSVDMYADNFKNFANQHILNEKNIKSLKKFTEEMNSSFEKKINEKDKLKEKEKED
jgi:receptor expression-enhancing protein 5/6